MLRCELLERLMAFFSLKRMALACRAVYQCQSKASASCAKTPGHAFHRAAEENPRVAGIELK